jgi:hypothetical protein
MTINVPSPRSIQPTTATSRPIGRRLAQPALTALLCLSAAAMAAETVPGTVVPSTGTTQGSKAAQPRSPAPPSTAGSLSGPDKDNRCPALRKRYAQSQSCFSRFRLKNGGLKPGAYRKCKEIPNPSLQCGSAVVG